MILDSFQASCLLIVSGIYDLVCSLCIFVFPKISPHLNMFEEDLDPVARCLLVYWILTYGTVRLVAGIQGSAASVAACTYFLEAVCVAHEWFCGSMVAWRAAFVVLVSVALGVILV